MARKLKQSTSADANTAPSGSPQLATETKFMQQYRIAAAVHGGGDITAIRNAAGQVEAFTIGTDGTVWNFYPDPASDTGYSGVSTGLNAASVSAGKDAAGRIVLFAGNHLTLNYVRENAPGSTVRWGKVQTATLPQPTSAITIAGVFAAEIGGSLYVAVLTRFQSASPGNTYAVAYCAWDDQAGVFNATTMTLSTLNCVWSGHSDATAEFTCLDTVYIGFNIATQKITRYPFSATFSSLSVATALDSAANNAYFAVLKEGNLYQMVGGSGGKPFSWAQLTQQQAFRQVAADVDATGAIHLFTLGSNNQVCHLAPSAASSTGWTEPAPIQTNVALLGVAQLDAGDIELFMVGTAQATLTHAIREAESGNWQTSALEVPTSGEVEEYISYSTDVMVYDATGAPMPGTAVQVWASSQTQLTVNGASYTVDAKTPANLVTSAAGALTLTQATGSLAIPTLEINVPAVSQTQSIALEQFAGVQADLAGVTGQALLDAKTADGSYLLGDSYRTPETTDSLAKAFNQCMALTVPPTTSGRSPSGFIRRRNEAGVTGCSKGSSATLNRVAVADPNQHWHLSFAGGRVVYQELAAADAAALLAEKRASHASSRLRSAALGGVFDWIEDIGDFIGGVVDGVVSVVDTVITAVGDAVQAAITFVMDGVTYLFETVVQFVEQAFDLVEVFFAQVKVIFEKIFEWLGFLFSWNDILRTHEALSYTVNQFLGFLPLATAGMQARFDSGIASVQAQITTIFDNLVAQVGGGSLGSYVDSNTPSEPSYSSSNSNNIVLNATLDNAGSASASPIVPGSNTPFDAVTQLINQLVTSVEANPAFGQAATYMTNLGGSPDQIFSQLVSALLRVVQGLAQAMISGVQSVVDGLFGLVQAFLSGITSLLNEEWDIPFVSQFYSWLTGGSPLTLLDLLSLIVAIPSTILFKALNGAAPFPDDASVSAFKASFNSATMLSNSGLAPQGLAVAPRTLVAAGLPATQQLLSIGGCLSFWAYGWLTAAMDIRPTTGGGVVDPLTKTLTKVALACEIMAQAIACPWIYSAGAPDCSTADGSGKTFWIYECLGVVMDSGFTWWDSAFPENNDTNAGIVLATLYGCGHTLITGLLGSHLSGLGLASKITLVIPETCKFLKLPSIETATEGVSLVVIAALDALCLPASGILSFADLQASSTTEARAPMALLPAAV